MAIRMWEAMESPRLSGNTAELVFYLDGTTDGLIAQAFAVGNSPTWYGGLWRDKTPPGVEPKGPDLWQVTVGYSKRDPEEPDVDLSFETGGATQHITQAIKHIASYAPEGMTPPDHQGAIGVTPDGIEGCDIVAADFKFAYTFPFSAGFVTNGFVDGIFRATGKTNSKQFHNFRAGEVLFLGATGSRSGLDKDDSWSITFSFHASENVDGLKIADIGPFSKRGWEYLWVEYREEQDGAAFRMVRRPIAVHIEQVYHDVDFDAAGIP